ncbi:MULTISPECIES: ribonuclease E inhibitor RraB [unclassified Rathayibacter]|uniref:ribonuclease E inhibitor RraB n=1 Tax=unclassified Rathayibacter TaxID=2609250 RepID=UPI00188CF8E9|nr:MULTISPECIES: ribonuclease E inhibitor RraB [unclassified Rathayibacter]MBF4462770.1 ribonuclease E inhibitor RraB [Rathayibacter sp. VKM Ac-2879]MBF4504184.1 ribonuclease E inhibitor RraB [Rathayibacter sp. VKM Ac-2878]
MKDTTIVAPPLSTFDAQRARAAHQLEIRLRYGDQVWELREVDHFAVFTRRSRARRAGRTLVALGFEIALSRLRVRHVLVASHFAAVDEEATEVFLRQVIEAVEDAGGRYDGWRAEIVPAH